MKTNTNIDVLIICAAPTKLASPRPMTQPSVAYAAVDKPIVTATKLRIEVATAWTCGSCESTVEPQTTYAKHASVNPMNSAT